MAPEQAASMPAYHHRPEHDRRIFIHGDPRGRVFAQILQQRLQPPLQVAPEPRLLTKPGSFMIELAALSRARLSLLGHILRLGRLLLTSPDKPAGLL
jgi:hypothetical protein